MNVYRAENGLFRTLFDAFPGAIVVVGGDRRVLYVNDAAGERFGLTLRAGDRADPPPPPDCPGPAKGGQDIGCDKVCNVHCLVRDAVQAAFAREGTSSAGVTVGADTGGGRREVRMLIGAFRLPDAVDGPMAVVTLSDASPVLRVGNIVSICSHTKRIRTEDGKWQEIERFFYDRAGVRFSHTLSPESMRELYGKEYEK